MIEEFVYFKEICKDIMSFLKENGSVSLDDYRNKIMEICEERIPYLIKDRFNALYTLMAALNFTKRVSIDYEENEFLPMTKANGKVSFEKDLDEKFWRNTKSYEKQFKNILSGKDPYGSMIKK